MEKFKAHWEIHKNWQLIVPFLGIIALGYSSYKLSNVFPIKDANIALKIALSGIIFFVLLKLTLFIFNKLESKWKVTYKWEMISIFLVFATTGTSSLFVSRPLIKLMGITKDNLSAVTYWILYVVIGFIFYQILLVLIGWLFGQYRFFWDFEKKMLRKIGFKRFLD